MIEHINFSQIKAQGIEQCQRIFHGRGKAYPGYEHVTVDWLPPVLLITLYQETSHDVLMDWANELNQALPECQSVQVRYRYRAKTPYETLLGEPIEKLIVEENGLKYYIQLGRNQNTGLFLDMANGRQWVHSHVSNKRVLNLFAYTCAFSVVALAGGASRIVNVDMSKSALSTGRENHRLNEQDLSKVKFEGVDIFKSFSRLKKHGPYDLLISDPPQFQKGSVDIKRDYKKIIRRIPELLVPGGQVMLCLNSPELTDDFLLSNVGEYCPSCEHVETIPVPSVFKESEKGRGLKVLVFTLG